MEGIKFAFDDFVDYFWNSLRFEKTNQNNKYMKKIFKFAAIVAATAALFSCQEKPEPTPTPDPDKPNQEQPETPQINENIKFTIELTEVTHELAKFKIKHDGVKADTWHYFPTTETDITKAIETEVAAIMAEGKSLQSSTSKNVTVRGLEAETTYSLVVFGLSTKGEVYGQPATFEFTTAAAPLEGFQVNPAWTVSYIGDYEYEGEILQHVVMVESTDTNPYFTTAWPKEFFDQTTIETIAEEEITAWVEYLTQSGKTLDYILSYESSLSQVSIDTKYGNEWYIIAIGADAKGNATGYYAISELVTIVEEEPTEEYAAWLGDWTFTGDNGVAFDVTFEKGVANQTYYMTGWEGLYEIPVTVNWLQDDNIWYIAGQVLIEETALTNTVSGSIYFLPYTANNLYNTVACVGGMTEDGTRISQAYEAQDESGATIVMEGMGYFGIGNDNNTYVLSEAMYYDEMPTFPITITPATTATQTSVKEFKVAEKSIDALKEFKTFGTKNVVVR